MVIARWVASVVLCWFLITTPTSLAIQDQRKDNPQESRQMVRRKLRGETIKKRKGAQHPQEQQQQQINRRHLFAERWSDPNNPQRGGAGGAAKGLTEVIPMRQSPVTTVPTTVVPVEPIPMTPIPTITTTSSTSTPSISQSVPTTSTTTVAPIPVTTPIPTPPTITTIPTVFVVPTQSPANRNDVCSRATTLPVSAEGMGVSGVFLVNDTTLGAQIDTTTNPERCNTISISAPGVWFVVPGTFVFF